MDCEKCVLSVVKLERELKDLKEQTKALRIIEKEPGVKTKTGLGIGIMEEAVLDRLGRTVVMRLGELDDCHINVGDLLHVFSIKGFSLSKAEMLCEQVKEWIDGL